MVETGQRAQLGNFNRTNQKILDVERCERKKDGFVTFFSISQLFIWHYLYKNLFSRTNRKDSAKGFRTFF
jgi:hypothetical protein